MEALAILFWIVVLNVDGMFMVKIPTIVREIENWLDNRKRPGRAGTRTRDGHIRTITLYTTGKGDVKHE